MSAPSPEDRDAEIDRLLHAQYAGDLAAARSAGCAEETGPPEVEGGVLPLCFGAVYGLVLGVGLTLLAQWVLAP